MTGRPTELVGMGYLTDAKAYLKAGKALSQSDIDMYSPVYFLCHGIELSLKAFMSTSRTNTARYGPTRFNEILSFDRKPPIKF
jgi:hypothetical protein